MRQMWCRDSTRDVCLLWQRKYLLAVLEKIKEEVIIVYISRKERKKLKKLNKPKLLKKQREEAYEIKLACKKIARQLSKGEAFEPNKKFHCPMCGQYWCMGFDNITQYCRDCFYRECCSKLSKGEKPCGR